MRNGNPLQSNISRSSQRRKERENLKATYFENIKQWQGATVRKYFRNPKAPHTEGASGSVPDE